MSFYLNSDVCYQGNNLCFYIVFIYLINLGLSPDFLTFLNQQHSRCFSHSVSDFSLGTNLKIFFFLENLSSLTIIDIIWLLSILSYLFCFNYCVLDTVFQFGVFHLVFLLVHFKQHCFWYLKGIYFF